MQYRLRSDGVPSSGSGLEDAINAAIDAPARAHWEIAARIGEEEQRALDAESLLEAQLLWNRGIRTAEDACVFLTPSTLALLGDPLTMRGMAEAVARLKAAIANGERIGVYGDYDVDGVAGAALLATAIRAAGGDVVVYVPDRARDGYGVNPDGVRRLAEAGIRVIVTVDCGVTANVEVALAAELGVDVIVADHHAVPAELPAAFAVLNPHHTECAYAFKELAAGGVALQLARALLAGRGSAEAVGEQLEQLAAFAALSTVADIVPLIGENRIIVRVGLAAARASGHPGLEALCRVAGRALSRLSAQDLAFSVIPRLNAASRMGDAHRALDLLLAEDAVTARELARTLDQANLARRERVSTILLAIEEEAAAASREGAIVLAGEYPVGLAGLIATRVTERHGVPCVVIERGDPTSRGSARGVMGVHLVKVLEACEPCLIQYGGHERAAGFSLTTAQIEPFRQRFVAAVRLVGDGQPYRRVLQADGVLNLSSIGPRLADLLDRFEPAGAGNARPTFISHRVLVRAANELRGGHFSLRLAQGMAVRRAVSFRPSFPMPVPGTLIDVLYEVERSTFAGEERVEMLVRDLRAAD
ncbi:MAG: single-stranded-DNA-specific exonuclease [Chloroflexota bacterium]|nr:single-stranded-DNA-specific exonuclease [Chloroflexota bacterium]